MVSIEVLGQRSDEVNQGLWTEERVVLRAFRTDRLNALRVSPNLTTSDADIERFLGLLEGAARG